MYHYKAQVTRVVDGDSVVFMVDCGFSIHKEIKVRLLGINTPETRTKNLLEKEAGKLVTQLVKETIENKVVYIKTEKLEKGKFGRYLANIYLKEDDVLSLNERLINSNYAKLYYGGKKTEWNDEELQRIISKLSE